MYISCGVDWDVCWQCHRPSAVFHRSGAALPTRSDLELDPVCVGGRVRNYHQSLSCISEQETC
ncbi:hypothetical protein BJX96DRAFT_145522 [Aspergillus floccosus]